MADRENKLWKCTFTLTGIYCTDDELDERLGEAEMNIKNSTGCDVHVGIAEEDV